MPRTKLSTKGQIVIPRPVREAHRWRTGTEFEIEDRPEGLLLKPIVPPADVSVSDVLGCTGYQGTAMTIEAMEEAVRKEARRRAKR